MPPLSTVPPTSVAASPQIPYVKSTPARRRIASFLDLPAELRNEIYVIALVLPDPLMIISGRVYRHLGDGNHSLVLIRKPCSKYSSSEPTHEIDLTF
jgi:hypothetical protein